MAETARHWQEAHQREHTMADKVLDRRLEDLNDLRKQVVADRSQFVAVGTYNAEHGALKTEMRNKHDATAARIDALEKIVDRFEGSVNTWRAIAGFLGVTGIGAVVYALSQAGRP